MRLLLIVSALVAGAFAGLAGNSVYRGHKLISVTPLSDDHASLMRSLMTTTDLDFWTERVAVGEETVLRVLPNQTETVERILKTNNVEYKVILEDLQVAVDAEAEAQLRASRAAKGLEGAGIPTDRFLRYGEIYEYMLQLSKKYPELVTLESFGKTPENRDMYVVKISKANGKAKRAVLVDAGIHAREWIAPAVATYLLSQLVENKQNENLLDGLDWYIVPVLNPDGYEYTHTSQRLWRKNRSRKASSSCPGVDMNRNFGFHWMENGASSNPCAETFAGTEAFSEIESQNFRDYVLKENKDSRIKMYLTLHSYGWYILYPWGFTSALPSDEKELRSISVAANEAMKKSGSRGYTIGTSTNVLYAAAGGSDDWAKGVAKIEKSFTIELPGGGSYGFDIPASKIKVTAEQVFEGLKVFAQRAKTL